MRPALFPPFLILLFPVVLPAQEARFELGQHLRAFEQQWDQSPPDAAARRRALPGLQAAFRNFFSLRLGEAARSLDQARWGLSGADEPPFPQRWAESLMVVPDARLFDVTDANVMVRVKPFYEVKGDIPAGAKLRLILGDQPPTDHDIPKLPASIPLPFPPLRADRDVPLTTAILIDGKEYARRSLLISRIVDLSKRLDAVSVAAEKRPEPSVSIEDGTLRHINDLLGFLRDRTVLETNYPAARLLAEAEAMMKQAKCYGVDRPGEFWWQVPTGDSSIVARVSIPAKLASGKVPLVVLLHGAGGSENLFYDGYGDGCAVKAALERGWIVVATRSPGFIGAPPVVKMVDHLVTRLPIDPARVYLIGHSMGSSQSIAVATRDPKRFAGVAVLGGGGTVRKSDALADLPFFIGVGKEDFALRSAQGLSKSLQSGGAKKVVLREYADVEHMAIVREAIADVYGFFDGK